LSLEELKKPVDQTFPLEADERINSDSEHENHHYHDHFKEMEIDIDLSESLKTERKVNPFELLGAYPKIEHPYIRPDYVNTMLGILRDDDYCYKVDMYHLENSEKILKKPTYFTNIPADRKPHLMKEKC